MSDMSPAEVRRCGARRGPVRGRAFTLVEALTVAGIMAAVLIPVLTVFQEGAHTAEVSIEETYGLCFAQELLEEMRTVVIEAGLGRMQPVPPDNPGPQYSAWQEWPTTGVTMPFPAAGTSVAVDTKGFGLTGQPLQLGRTPPAWAPYLRLYQSPLPVRFARRLKVHPAVHALSPFVEDSDLIVLEAVVSWDDTRTGAMAHRREVTLRAVETGGSA